MFTSNYLISCIRLSLLLLTFLLSSCVNPEGTTGGRPIVEETATPTTTSPEETATSTTIEAASSEHFSYTVRVSDKDTGGPIQGAEVSIKLELNEGTAGPKTADPKGQVVFTFEIDQADQAGELRVKAEGYREQIFQIALKVGSEPENVQLSSLTTKPLETFTPTATAAPPPNETLTPPPPDDTPTSTPTGTSTSTPPPPTETPTPTPAAPTGNLAIPVVFNFGTKVYLTGFDGAGINGPNEISIDAQQPMFSSDGKSVMVKAIIDGVIGLYKLTSSGFSPEIIIKRGSAEWPVLSPDGKTVLFTESTLQYRLHKRSPSDQIETSDANIEEVWLNGFPIFATNLLWSEDNQLVFQGCAVWIEEPGTCGTWVTDASNLNPRRILVGNEAQPMAIKGDILAYMVRAAGEDWDIYLMSLNSGETRNITDNDFEDGLPAISPDGDAIAYISNESGKWGVWTVDLDGQNKKHWFDIDPVKGVLDINQWNKERMSWRR